MAVIANLAAFIAEAPPGASYPYFRGMLAKALDDEEVREVRALAFTAAMSGYFDLLQRRLAADDYVYFIRRRRKRDEAW